MSEWRDRLARAFMVGFFTLSPVEGDPLSPEPPPAAMLPVGEPVPMLGIAKSIPSLQSQPVS